MEESEISIKKDFGHVLATGYWQIPLIFQISVAVHTQIAESKKLIHRIIMPIFVTHESVMSVKTSSFEHWKKTNKYLPIINQLLILSI